MSDGAVEDGGTTVSPQEPAALAEAVGVVAGRSPLGRSERRPGLAVVSAAHALVFAVAAAQLPWSTSSWPMLLLGAFAVAHAVLAVLSVLGRERWVRPSWAGLALAALLLWFGTTVAIAAAGLHLAALYQGLGAALAGALFVLAAVLALFTVPFAVWGLAVTRPWLWLGGGERGSRRVVLGLLVGLGTVVIVALTLALGSGSTKPVSAWGETQPEALWARIRARLPPLAASTTKKRRRAATLHHQDPAVCGEPVTGPHLTALVTWLGRSRKPAVRCVQASTPAALEEALIDLLGKEPHARSRAVVDFVVARRELTSAHPWLDALAIRAARDGVCAGGACLAPWQLVALESFTTERPVPAVPDFRFGVSREALGRALGGRIDGGPRGGGAKGDDAKESRARESAASGPWVAIETETYTLVEDVAERLSRLRLPPQELDEVKVERAVRAAERHIVGAQGKDGRFRYALNPFTGQDDWASLNLPRQAGTTLVLCELGSSKAGRRAAKKSLALLAGHERRLGRASVLTTHPRSAALGHTALPLVALLQCRDRHGKRHDALILRLAEFLLQMQRDDGSFFAAYDLDTGSAGGRHEALYASGQAVLALVLLEQRLSSLGGDGEPSAERVRSAIDRAMHHYAVEYWPRFLRDFFYLEENWHCLAARAALSSHRHHDYEQLCIDYVAFKSRLILRRGEVPADLVGGFGVSAVFEPHTTGSAGHGEALAAALALQRVRGEDRGENLAVLEDVLRFLVRSQWDEASCFACSPRQRVVGGFSEHVASPIIRIDYVQHAMAALGHGGHELFRAAKPAAQKSGS